MSLAKLPCPERVIDELRKLNVDFQMLSRPLYEAIRLRRKTCKWSIPQHTEELEKYQVVRKASRLFYEALHKAYTCTRHSQLLVHFCVQVERLVLDYGCSTKIGFSMAFTYVQPPEPQAAWFSIGSVLDELKIQRRQNEPVADELYHYVAKRTPSDITFDSPIECAHSFNSTTSQVGNLALESHLGHNICEFQRSCFQSPSTEGISLKTVEETTTCMHVIRPLLPACSRSLQPILLQQLIKSTQGRPGSEDFSLSERIRLAKALATAVLQYHSTPWLQKT